MTIQELKDKLEELVDRVDNEEIDTLVDIANAIEYL